MRRLLSTFFVVFLFLKLSNAQAPFFQHYSILRKNEPVRVNTIFQDRTGYIWYGTNKGLFKFDGIKQKRFTVADSLRDENITAIAEDSSGKIWIGHKNGSLAFIEKNQIKKFDPPEGSAAAEISDIIFDKKGNLWFSTLGDGLYYFIKNRLFRLDEIEKMPDLFIYDITEDREGNIWAGTDGGVAICTLRGKAVTTKILNYDKGLPDNIIKKLAVSSDDGTIWMGTEEAGIINYNAGTGRYTPLFDGKWEYGALTDFIFSGKQVWISCLQKGLMIYDRHSGQMKMVDAKAQSGFAVINTLFEDREGNIWIGSESGITRTPGDFIQYIETFEPLDDNKVIALAVDKQGSIWFSNKEGLFKRTISKSGSANIEKQFINSPFQKHTIISLFIDADGYVWAGSYGEGVLRLNPLNGKIRYLNKELRDGNVLNIAGRDHYVWLATLGGATQIKISGDELIIKNYTSADGLISDFIYQVFVDSKNRTWFGTDGKGVNMLDESGFHHYKEGLGSEVVYGFAEDSERNIWANTQGAGIYKFDGAKFCGLNTETLLHDNNVNCFTSDRFGMLVVMHDLGIDIYDTKKKSIRYFGDQHGIHDRKPNLNSVVKDQIGRIYFGTDRGIVIYSHRNNYELNSPEPFIEDLKVLGENTELSQNLNFKYDQNDITINYSGFWYQDPENLNFRYMLENYDRDWITSRNYSVAYSSLPPGEYTFRLKVSDSDKFSESKETSFSFVVHPPFWKTNWFYILSIITGICLIYLLIKIRENELQKDKKILEEKNAELKKINMELDKFVYSVSHDLRAPLLSMQGIVELTDAETKEDLTSEHMKFLKGSIHKLDGFIGDILNYSRNSRMEIKADMINFNELLNEITGNLRQTTGSAKRVAVRIDVKEKAKFYSDAGRLHVVLNNLISNSIRYHNPEAEESYVNIHIETDEKMALITVKDNGVGISEKYQQKVFEMFCRVSENSSGSGLGLYIVKETVDKMQGEIQIESVLGKGTTFHLRVPNLFFQ